MTNPNSPPANPGPASPRDAERPSYLTIEELSAVTAMSVSTLRRLRSKGLIVGYQPGGPRHRVVFPPDAIEQLARAAQPSGNGPIPSVSPVTATPTPLRGPQPKWRRGA